MGLQLKDKLKEKDKVETEEDEIDIADEEGLIRHRALNVAFLKKY